MCVVAARHAQFRASGDNSLVKMTINLLKIHFHDNMYSIACPRQWGPVSHNPALHAESARALLSGVQQHHRCVQRTRNMQGASS